MEIYDFSVAPGEVKDIHCQGVYVYFYSGSAGGADATIALKHDASGERVLLLPGQAFRLEDGARAGRWIVSNYAGAATIAGRLVIGTGRIDDNRITGSVEVIDGGKARTIAGLAFLGSATQAAVAGQYAHIELWNPAASGKNAIVSKLQVNSAAAQGVSVRSHAAALTTLYSNPPSKKLGGAASSMELRVQTSASYIFTGAADMITFNCQANTSVPYQFAEPIVIPPGQGLVAFVNSPVNQSLSAAFEFYRESV